MTPTRRAGSKLGPGCLMLVGLPVSVQLQWIASLPASALHAADALRRGLALTDEEVAAALTEPAQQLCQEIRAIGVPEEAFWDHMLALATDLVQGPQLAEVVLRKVVGPKPESRLWVGPLGARITTLVTALRRVRPGLVDQVAQWAEPLQKAWETLGTALMTRVGELTEPGLIASEARAIALYPVLAGSGRAHLAYNLVHLEVMDADPVPELPELVRAAWLVAQLHADLPAYSETLRRDRLPALAGVAMLAPVLAAAEELELVPRGVPLVEHARQAWQIDTLGVADFATAVDSWWTTYGASRPPWNVALAALDRLLDQ